LILYVISATLNAPERTQMTPIGNDEHFRLLVEAVQDYAIYLLDANGHILTWNTGAERNKGYTADEVVGKPFSIFFRPEDIASDLPGSILRTAATEGRFSGEGWRVRKDGSHFWASVTVNALRNSEGEVTGYAKVTRDLTERRIQDEALHLSERALQNERDRLRVTLYSLAEGIIATDKNGIVTMANPTAEMMTGWKSNEANGRAIHDILYLFDTETLAIADNPIWECLALNTSIDLPEGISMRARGGRAYDVQGSVAPIRTATGDPIGTVFVLHDVTRLRMAQKELLFSATHDPLTGLPNRRMFLDTLEKALSTSKQPGMESAVCFLDLDSFKIVNDTVGHAAGDVLLRQIANLLNRHIRSSDLVARLGGDEFGIILRACSLQKAEGILTQIVQAISTMNFPWEKRLFHISASVGVTETRPGSDTTTVMKEADVACYAAKHAGKDQISVYNRDHGACQESHEQIQIVAEVREALIHNRFFLFAQKIAPLSSAGPQKRHEILLRMRSAQGMLIAPAQFIPAAERYSQMRDIDKWVFESVLGNLDGALSTIANIHLNLNISANSLNDAKFLPFFLRLLERSKLHPKELTLEITESALINNLISASGMIEKVRAIGCRVALDDFGIGMCSFSYLRNFQVDDIKIDGSFVRSMHRNKVDLSIVKAINNIAHEMGSQTIAEFVEDDAVLAATRNLGIDFAQGHAIGKPEPIETVFQHSPQPEHFPSRKAGAETAHLQY
jgi:diguanylate cyclase (GGDEF)-like protein/PAS domain S-box-containing protein